MIFSVLRIDIDLKNPQFIVLEIKKINLRLLMGKHGVLCTLKNQAIFEKNETRQAAQTPTVYKPLSYLDKPLGNSEVLLLYIQDFAQVLDRIQSRSEAA